MGNEWIKKLWDINTHTHYPVIENKVLTFKAKRMELGDIWISERPDTERQTLYVLSNMQTLKVQIGMQNSDH